METLGTENPASHLLIAGEDLQAVSVSVLVSIVGASGVLRRG